ncbi:hypothetical protein QTG54_000518 [Skeletonema marinoi]|uniref:TFIIS N-terminal domain-containing protein n=1 Tax=Skeletonema marinoi TaxID=267567 RepID=A0AAD8YN89_9STRA|nr:hypothetical protein QTG54_000518 [Skeletonema marinoi]
MLNRLDDLNNIDIDILTETKIGVTVASFRKKYSQVITIKARALVRKWKRVYEDATNTRTSTQQNNVAEVKVESSNSNDIEGSYKKSDDNDDDDNRTMSNEISNNCTEGNFKSDDGNIRDTSNENNEIDGTPNEQQSTQAGNKETKMVCDICSKPANFREELASCKSAKTVAYTCMNYATVWFPLQNLIPILLVMLARLFKLQLKSMPPPNWWNW